jgi:hypothetical protein
MKQLGEADVTRRDPPPANLYGGTVEQVRDLCLQRPNEIVSGDPTVGVDSPERLIRQIPPSPQETPGLAERAVKVEVFETLQGILSNKGMNRSLGRQDLTRGHNMRAQALLLPLSSSGTKKVKPPEAVPIPFDHLPSRSVLLIGGLRRTGRVDPVLISAHRVNPLSDY